MCELRFSASLIRCCYFPLPRAKDKQKHRSHVQKQVVKILSWKICLGFIISFVTNSKQVIVWLIGNQASQQLEMQELRIQSPNMLAAWMYEPIHLDFFYLLLTSTSGEHQHKSIEGQNVCVSYIFVSNSQLRFRGMRHDHWDSVYRVEQRFPWFQKCFRHNLMEMLGSFINTHQRLTCTLEHIANILA